MAERDSILELTDTELEQERRINSESKTQPPSVNSDSQPQPREDLVDTFNLLRNYLDHKLVDLKYDIISEQNTLSQKLREEANIKFKSEGNRIQFRFNEEILNGVQKLYKHLLTSDSSIAKVAADLIGKIKDRNKLITIADTSVGGWTTVREYEANDVADNDEDEKKIRQAESRALKSIKEKTKSRPQPYVRPPPAKVETAPKKK